MDDDVTDLFELDLLDIGSCVVSAGWDHRTGRRERTPHHRAECARGVSPSALPLGPDERHVCL